MTEIRIVGTAHVSQKSVEEVRAAIEEFQPDVVGVELDRRFISLTEETADPTIDEILRRRELRQAPHPVGACLHPAADRR